MKQYTLSFNERNWRHQAIAIAKVYCCDIHLVAVSQGVPTNLIHNTCSEMSLLHSISRLLPWASDFMILILMCSGSVGGSGDYILEKVPQTRQDQVTFLYSRYSRKSQIRAHSYILYRLSGWLHTVYYSLAQTTPITWLTSEQWPWPGLEVNSLKIVTAQYYLCNDRIVCLIFIWCRH